MYMMVAYLVIIVIIGHWAYMEYVDTYMGVHSTTPAQPQTNADEQPNIYTLLGCVTNRQVGEHHRG